MNNFSASSKTSCLILVDRTRTVFKSWLCHRRQYIVKDDASPCSNDIATETWSPETTFEFHGTRLQGQVSENPLLVQTDLKTQQRALSSNDSKVIARKRNDSYKFFSFCKNCKQIQKK